MLVARRVDETIGTIRLVTPNPMAIDCSSFTPVATALYVLGLAVAPDAQGQGVGRGLMEAAKEVARRRPVEALWLDAYEHEAGAGLFYIKCGFQPRGRTTYGKISLKFHEWLS